MKKIIISLCTLCMGTMYAQNYGQLTYPIPGAIMSSAVITTATFPGSHLMAGYEPNFFTNTYNFAICKTAPNGTFNSSGPIRNLYTVSRVGLPNCANGSYNIVNNCEGVTAIETGQASYPYAVAGAADYGCYFATLDINGFVVNMMEYPFPFAQSGNGKPLLLKSGQQVNTYYIVGQWNNQVYTMAVNNTGAIIWSKLWTLPAGSSFIPKSFIEIAPTISGNAGNLAIVGQYYVPGVSNATDGFLMKLDYTNGNLTLFKGYDGGTLNPEQGFTDIKFVGPLRGQQYAICGWNNNVNFKGWLIEVAGSGAITWNTLYGPFSDPYPSKVAALLARVNTSLQYEFHVSSYSSVAGMQLCKFDASGNPFTGINEGQYWDPTPPGKSSATALDMTATPFQAITSYGDADGTTPGAFYYARSYFNEVSGCGNNFSSFPFNHDPFVVVNLTPTISGALTSCSLVTLHWVPITIQYTTTCGPFSSVAGGSNARLTGASTIEEAQSGLSNFNVFPNPSNDKTTISYSIDHDGAKVKLELYNHLGQLIKTITNEEMNAGSYNSNIDFKAMDMESGMYLLTLSVDGHTSNTKVLYNK